MAERVLMYERSIVPQETSWWCGPAATQIVLNARGIRLQEQWIAAQIEQIENPGRGDDKDGTDYVGLIEKFLARQVPDARYASVYMPDDPPKPQQKERLWRDLKSSIDAGWGVVANFVAPPNNYPRGVKGSVSPRYGSGTIYHYVAILGYDDNPAGRAVWVADSGFQPQGYWISFDQCATLIPPKGYCYSTVEPPSPADRVSELSARVDRLTEALTVLLGLLESKNPELLKAYLEATKGKE